MTIMLIRFCAGGLIVSAFAVLSDIFRPKSFAGLFGAAPSVALATLTLTVAKNGASYAAIEARSMIAGAVALCCYCQVVSWVMMRFKWPSLTVTIASVFIWFAVALGLWFILLK
jgi:Protein of unknown function (DUF3147)